MREVHEAGFGAVTLSVKLNIAELVEMSPAAQSLLENFLPDIGEPQLVLLVPEESLPPFTGPALKDARRPLAARARGRRHCVDLAGWSDQPHLAAAQAESRLCRQARG